MCIRDSYRDHKKMLRLKFNPTKWVTREVSNGELTRTHEDYDDPFTMRLGLVIPGNINLNVGKIDKKDYAYENSFIQYSDNPQDVQFRGALEILLSGDHVGYSREEMMTLASNSASAGSGVVGGDSRQAITVKCENEHIDMYEDRKALLKSKKLQEEDDLNVITDGPGELCTTDNLGTDPCGVQFFAHAPLYKGDICKSNDVCGLKEGKAWTCNGDITGASRCACRDGWQHDDTATDTSAAAGNCDMAFTCDTSDPYTWSNIKLSLIHISEPTRPY